MRYLFIALVAFLTVQCNCKDPSDIDPTSGYVIPQKGTTEQAKACQAAEDNLLRPGMQCKTMTGEILGGKNKRGEAFVDTCQNLLANHLTVRTTCLATAKTCQEVQNCQ